MHSAVVWIVMLASVVSTIFSYIYFIDRSDAFLAKLHGSMLIYGTVHFLIGFAAGGLLSRVQRRRPHEDAE